MVYENKYLTVNFAKHIGSQIVSMKLKEKKERAMASNFRGQGLLDRLNGKHVIVLKVVGLAYFDSFFNTFELRIQRPNIILQREKKPGAKELEEQQPQEFTKAESSKSRQRERARDRDVGFFFLFFFFFNCLA